MSEKQTRTTGATQLALGAVLGAVGVLGYGVLFANERGPGSGAAGAADTNAPANANAVELAAALRDLQRVLESIETTLQRADAPSPRPTRTPARVDGAPDASSSPSSADPTLAESLAEIASALRTLRAAGADASPVAGATSLVPPLWIDRSTAFSGDALKAASLSEDEATWEAAFSAFSEKHLLWSQQEVLSAYGKPDNIWVTEQTAMWQYTIVDPGEGEEEFSFRFHGGLVYSVSYDFDEE